MTNTLPDFTKASVLVVGDIMLDRYWFGDVSRISPEAPVPVVKINQTNERPGGAGNVALNLAKLGVQVTLLGVTGQDKESDFLRKQLTSVNIRTDLISLNDVPTITKLRILSRNQQLLRLDFEEKFLSFDKEVLIRNFQKHIQSVDAVILSDYNKGTLICSQDLIQAAKKANIPIIIDPKGMDFKKYRGANFITPNLKEFEAVMGPCSNEKELLQKSREFLKTYDIETLLLTRGENGMTLISQHEEEFHLPAHAREVFDVTGAGDTVIAVLSAAIAAGSNNIFAVSLANLAASLVVAKLGAAAVSAAELETALNQATSVRAGVLNEEQLEKAVHQARTLGKKIVFTNGCFDILHAGHVQYLQQAKLLGDILIVAVNSDESVTQLKGKGRPINTLDHRMAVLAALGVVDWVISFKESSPERLLQKLQPDILVKGGDYTVSQVVGAPIVQSYGGEVRVLGVIKNTSSSTIIERILNLKEGVHV